AVIVRRLDLGVESGRVVDVGDQFIDRQGEGQVVGFGGGAEQGGIGTADAERPGICGNGANGQRTAIVIGLELGAGGLEGRVDVGYGSADVGAGSGIERDAHAADREVQLSIRAAGRGLAAEDAGFCSAGDSDGRVFAVDCGQGDRVGAANGQLAFKSRAGELASDFGAQVGSRVGAGGVSGNVDGDAGAAIGDVQRTSSVTTTGDVGSAGIGSLGGSRGGIGSTHGRSLTRTCLGQR